jgi:anti-sigma factor RsiW
MSLDEQQMLDVMAYADGELAGEELARVEALVGSDEEAKELYASLQALGDGVRGVLDVAGIDVRDAVMAKLAPNDLDKARIKRTARTRMVVVGASLVALAAAVLLYVRSTGHPVAKQNTPSTSASGEAVLASAARAGVEVDFVDSRTPVSVFYVPAETASTGPGAKNEPPPSVVVWIDDSAPEKSP